MAWQFLAWTAGTFFVVLFCYLLRPLEFFPITFVTLIATAFIVFDPREWMLQSYLEAHEFLLHVPINDFVERYLHTAVTIISGLWLVLRTCQTLLKPVSELVMVLGVDIPDPPNVCLAGIRSDAVTLTWDRPPSNKPVHKYTIQVNGVHVGESPGNDFAITVTGLKPSHYYSIRVIAVAPNSFQSPSPPVLLQTWGKDGKPQPIDAPLPANCSTDEDRLGSADNGDDSDSPSGPVPSLESAPVLDSPVSVLRDPNGSLTNQRRNTVNRRHSPSVTSSERPQTKYQSSNEPEESLDELNKQFESIRKEIDDVVAQIAKEEADFKLQEDELKREKDRKRRILKEKEEYTAQLKAEVRSTMEQMRAAEKERAKKEQCLKDKEAKKAKSKDNIKKMEQEMERMRNDRKKFQAQRADLVQQRDEKVRSLDQANKELQDKCAELESELKEKGKQLQDLKVMRKMLPGASDESWDVEDRRLENDFVQTEQHLKTALIQEMNRAQELDLQIQTLVDQIAQAQQQHQQAYYLPMSSTGPEYDSSISVQQARPSVTGASPHEQGTPSPHPLPTSESGYPPPAGFVHAPFPRQNLFPEEPDSSDEPQAEAELKTANGLPSPLAQTLLPSYIFDELDDQGEECRAEARLPEAISITGDEPQSPASSSPSYRAFSSPHGSSQNLPYSQYEPYEPERSSLNPHQAPNSPAASTHRFSGLLSTFQRNRGTKPVDEGPPIGSLKPGQSQSFPRGTEELDGNEIRRRRNFLWPGRSSTGPEGTTGPFSLVGRRLNSLSNGLDRESDSRPASIASSDLPRPSTDSGSIWGQPSDSALPKHRLWQTGEGRWSSRSNSRRPSIHGTGNLLTTTLASADDEILDENDLRNPPHVGVIGSGHPTTTKSVNQRLNPNAPTFIGNLFKKDKSKSRDATPSIELPLNTDDSPSEPRISRETQSIHTQASVSVSESHESLTLDGTVSNAPSDLNSLSGSVSKDAENKVKKLFRKGSSGKFSLTSRLGKDSGLFKKGPGSTANSDKNVSADQRSSIGDVDDVGEEAQFGRSYDSMASSSALGSKGSRDGNQSSRIGSWRFSNKKKKAKEMATKESLDIDRKAKDEQQ